MPFIFQEKYLSIELVECRTNGVCVCCKAGREKDGYIDAHTSLVLVYVIHITNIS